MRSLWSNCQIEDALEAKQPNGIPITRHSKDKTCKITLLLMLFLWKKYQGWLPSQVKISYQPLTALMYPCSVERLVSRGPPSCWLSMAWECTHPLVDEQSWHLMKLPWHMLSKCRLTWNVTSPIDWAAAFRGWEFIWKVLIYWKGPVFCVSDL